MKRRNVKYADERSVQACIDQLQAIIEGLRSGMIGLEQEEQSLVLRPGGLIDFALRVDQLERKETLRVDMTWRPAVESLRGADAGAPESETRPLSEGARSEGPITARPAAGGSASPSEAPLPPWQRPVVSEYEQLYARAGAVGSDGQWHIDRDQLMESLAQAGVDPLTQQELYSFALLADADGRGSVLSERVIAALEQASQRSAQAAG